MKKLNLVILVLLYSTVFSQTPNGSRSLIHTQTARTFDKGRLEVHTNMNFFTRVTEFVGTGTKPTDFGAVNYWMVAGNAAITYGITDHFDFTVAPRIYQDTHSANEYNLPGDIFITLKAGSFAFAKRKFYGAVLTNFRIGSGEEHNYPFAEYCSGAFEYGFGGALSFYADPYLPDRAFNAHLNAGWWNHNEAGKEVFKDRTATKNSSELQFGLGLVYPTAMFDFRLEVNGINYTSQPDTMVYSRENWMYVTPSIRYKPLSWLSLDLGVDIRISSDTDETSGVPNKSSEDFNLPNYCPWKVQMGLNLTILPFTSTRKSTAEIEKDEFHKRVEFFQQIVEERERSEDVQEELERLKDERESAERELEELKQILQEEGN